MDDYFNREFDFLERELTQLKTSSQRSASAVSTVIKTVNVSVNLQYEDISYPTGSARALVYYEVDTDEDVIIMPTLSWYYGDITQAANVFFTTRRIDMDSGWLTPSNKYGIALYFIGTEQGDNSDAARTKRGETVTVSVDLTVLCTQDFTLTRLNI